MTTNVDPPVGGSENPVAAGGEIVARPDRWYAFKWYAMSLALILGGAWFLYDGYVKYPAANEAARQKGWDHLPYTDLSLRIQRILGFTLPPLGLACGIWTAWAVRGRYRFADNVLFVPGHPPVPLDAIREIDKRKWDRKGVAWLAYELTGAGGQTGRLKLDDFAYERKPTDAILARIEAEVAPDEGGEADSGAPPARPVVSEPLESRDMI